MGGKCLTGMAAPCRCADGINGTSCDFVAGRFQLVGRRGFNPFTLPSFASFSAPSIWTDQRKKPWRKSFISGILSARFAFQLRRRRFLRIQRSFTHFRQRIFHFRRIVGFCTTFRF